MLIRDIMNPSVVSISPDESASLAARLLCRHNIGSLPVCTDDGKLRGIITDRDIVLRCVATDSSPESTPVKEIMSRSVITVAPNEDVSVASRLMAQAQVRRLPVVSNSRLVGMVALGDLARRPACDMEAGKALSDISSNVRNR